MRAELNDFNFSPQCQPSAIVHLRRTCDVTSLFNDRAYQDPAEAVCQLGKSPTEEWQLQI